MDWLNSIDLSIVVVALARPSGYLQWSWYYHLLEVRRLLIYSVWTLAPECRVDGSCQRVIDWCHKHKAMAILIWQLDKTLSATNQNAKMSTYRFYISKTIVFTWKFNM